MWLRYEDDKISLSPMQIHIYIHIAAGAIQISVIIMKPNGFELLKNHLET